MKKTPVLEPNPAGGRELTPEFFREQIKYIEDYVSLFACRSGLLAAGSEHKQPLASLIAPNVVGLDALHAIGERGHLLSSGQAGGYEEIEPCDVHNLGTGAHRIYACLASDKTPCGEPLEIYPDAPATKQAWIQRHLSSRLILAADSDRFQYRDWLQVAEVWRVRESGGIRTQLNARFHPAITTMKAYCRPNPLPTFAAHIQELLAAVPQDPMSGLLTTELNLLDLIAEDGSPAHVFLQVQRCLGVMCSLPEPISVLGRTLHSYRYAPSSFCEFLASLRDLCGTEMPERYPDILKIDGQSFYRLPGEIQEADEFWVWKPDRSNFLVNSVAVYLPAVQPGTVPNIRYGQHARAQGQFPIAAHGKSISGPGSAIVMDEFEGEINSVYFTVDAIGLQQRFRMQLGEGHAVYYF